MNPVQADNRPPPDIESFFAHAGNTPLINAFTVKRMVPPFAGMQAVPDDEMAACWSNLVERPRNSKSLAYLQVPFCENHCLFCGFYQNPWHEEAGGTYTDTLIAHLQQDADRAYQASGLIHAVYLGGGTPSTLSPADLARLLRAVHDYLPLAPDCEITLEGRPFSLDRHKIEAALAAGANRISLGVQTFDTAVRRSMARRAPRETVIELLEFLVATDAAAIVIDLIYGLPGQSPEIWADDVRTAIDTGIDGVDLYSLNLFPMAPLAKAIDKGKFTPIPREHYGNYFAAGAQLLHDARWEAISTTHWRRVTRERNLYNLEIKQGAQCLAFGPGAGGFLGGYAYGIIGELDVYQAAIDNGRSVLSSLRHQPDDQDLFDRIRGAMECARLDHAWLGGALAARGIDPDCVAPLFAQWAEAGLLTMDARWLDLTVAGRFWQVTMTHNLIEWLKAQHAAATKPQ
jgi:oxygen-independent coproporphyrinogen-3 oxidase